MAKKLNAFVHVEDDDGVRHVFGPEDTVPAWASKKIGDHAYAKSDEDEDEVVAGPSQVGPPAKNPSEVAKTTEPGETPEEAKAKAEAEAAAKAATGKA